MNNDTTNTIEAIANYRQQVFAFAYKRCRDENTAEDITQDTMIKAIANVDQFDTSRSLLSWLFNITGKMAIDYYRRERYRQCDNIADADTIEPATYFDTLATVRDHMTILDDTDRTIVELRLSGVQIVDIADQIGLHVNTVSKRLAKLRPGLQSAIVD